MNGNALSRADCKSGQKTFCWHFLSNHNAHYQRNLHQWSTQYVRKELNLNRMDHCLITILSKCWSCCIWVVPTDLVIKVFTSVKYWHMTLVFFCYFSVPVDIITSFWMKPKKKIFDLLTRKKWCQCKLMNATYLLQSSLSRFENLSISKGVTNHLICFFSLKRSKILAYYRDLILCLIWRNVWLSTKILRHQLNTQNYLQTLDVLLRHQVNHIRCESRYAISNSHL